MHVQKNNKVSSINKINTNKIHANYLLGNPVNLFWLGGPLPGLTILHNMKKYSKNVVVNDLIYEGYNEGVNESVSENINQNINQNVNESINTNEKINMLNNVSMNNSVNVLNNVNMNDNINIIHNNNVMLNDNSTNNFTCSTMSNMNEEQYNIKHCNIINNNNFNDVHNNMNDGHNNMNKGHKKLIKRFIGKATWDMNQLVDELNNDYWIAINCDNKELLSNIIFNASNETDSNNINNNFDNSACGNVSSNSYKGECLWEKILASLNNDYEQISKIPQTVIDNFLKDFKSIENE